MKITPWGFAVLDDDKDSLLSRYCEKAETLNHDPEIDRVFASHIKPGDVCIDAGAAIGDHTSAYIQKAGSAELVHAFECNPLMLECLRHNCPGCQVHPFALSDKHGYIYMHHDSHNAGASYVDGAEGDYKVISTRLDCYFLPKVDYIKWDIEGYELKGIRGARETIMRCRPVMIIEVIHQHVKRAGHTVDELFDELRLLNYKWAATLGELREPYTTDLLCDPL